MPEELGTTNKHFAEELRRYERAFVPGTREYAHRRDYPGDAARKHKCANNHCINFDFPVLETYWLCEACSAVAPDTIHYFRNAPYKTNPPKRKRAQSNAASFAVWCKNRPRPSPSQ